MYSQKSLAFGQVLTCLSLAVLLAGCDIVVGPSIRGSGVAKSETREIGRFSEIEVGNAIEVEATVGPATSLVVTTDDNLLPQVKTVVAGERLKIYMNGSSSTGLGVKVKVTSPQLRTFAGSGAVKATVAGMSGEEFELELSGASHCHLSGDAEHLDVRLSGASRATIAGTAKKLTAECSGASHIDGRPLNAEIVAIELSGASTGRVNAKNELSVGASGASTLRYAGQPAKLEKQSSGASTVLPE